MPGLADPSRRPPQCAGRRIGDQAYAEFTLFGIHDSPKSRPGYPRSPAFPSTPAMVRRIHRPYSGAGGRLRRGEQHSDDACIVGCRNGGEYEYLLRTATGGSPHGHSFGLVVLRPLPDPGVELS